MQYFHEVSSFFPSKYLSIECALFSFMRTISTLLMVFLLTVSFASASWSPYFTVVDDTAPASVVVDAANFAASMKASTAVSFSGRVVPDVLSTKPGDEEFLVVFDGKTAWILRDPKSTIAYFDTVEPTAKAYLEDQGFTVLDSPPSSQSEKKTVIQETKPSAPSPEVNETSENSPLAPVAPQPVVDVQEEEFMPEPDKEWTQEDTSKPDDETPGVLSRLWRWFVDIFE